MLVLLNLEDLEMIWKLSWLLVQVQVLAPAATCTEFVDQALHQGGIDGDTLFSPEVVISAEQLAEYAYQLGQSDKVAGIVKDLSPLMRPPIVPSF